MAMFFWLVNPNRSRVKRFIENTNNKDQFFKYIFIDSGKVTSTWGKGSGWEFKYIIDGRSKKIPLAKVFVSRSLTQF